MKCFCHPEPNYCPEASDSTLQACPAAPGTEQPWAVSHLSFAPADPSEPQAL